LQVGKAIDLYLEYHRLNSQKNTARSYESLLSKFRHQFPDCDSESILPEEVLSFLVDINDGCKQLTKHTRYPYLKAFFNFIRNNLHSQLPNPCDAPMLKKLFRAVKLGH
jgi:site-specific recombinase XerD